MSKARLVITAVASGGMTQAEAATAYGVSPGWVSKLMARYRTALRNPNVDIIAHPSGRKIGIRGRRPWLRGGASGRNSP